MREDSNTSPPAPVARMLAALGYVSVDLPNRAPWWQAPNGKAGPWEEAVDAASAEIVHLRQVAALAPKSFWRSREGRFVVVAVGGVVGTGLGLLSGYLTWLPESIRGEVGSALMFAGTAISAWFARERASITQQAALEQAKALADGPKVGG